MGAIGEVDNILKGLGAFEKAKLGGKSEAIASYGRKIRASLERGLIDETARIQQALRETQQMGAGLPDYAKRLLAVEPDEIIQTNRRIHANLTLKEGAEGWVVDRQKAAVLHEGGPERLVEPAGRFTGVRFGPASFGVTTQAESRGLPSGLKAREAAFLADEDRTMKDLLAALADKPNRFTVRPNSPGLAGTLARSALGQSMLGGAKAAFEPAVAEAQEGLVDPLKGSLFDTPWPQFAPGGDPLTAQAAKAMIAEAKMARGIPMAESAIATNMPAPEIQPPSLFRQVAMPRESDAFFAAPDAMLPPDLPQEARDLIRIGRGANPITRRETLAKLMDMKVIPFEPPAHQWLQGFPIVDDRLVEPDPKNPAYTVLFNELILDKERSKKLSLKQSMKIRRALNAGEPVIGFLTEIDPEGEVTPAQPSPAPAPMPQTVSGEEGAKRREYEF